MNPNIMPENVDKDQFKPSIRDGKDCTFYDSNVLFGNCHQIAISHNGTIYRLRITRFGKLILNK